MTGGQFSPLSGPRKKVTTAPYLTIDSEFDIVSLATAAGETFVARSTAYHVRDTTAILKKALQQKGFSVVEILSQCPTHYAGRTRKGMRLRCSSCIRPIPQTSAQRRLKKIRDSSPGTSLSTGKNLSIVSIAETVLISLVPCRLLVSSEKHDCIFPS